MSKIFFLIITSNLIYLTLHLTASDQYAEVLASGIMFHEVSKILRVKKCVNIEFLVPFPKYTFEVKSQIEKRLQTFAEMWATPTIFCPMDESRPFNASSKPFNVNWLYTKLLAELQAAKNDVFEMGNETAILLTMEEQRQRRQKRGLPPAAVALAGISVFGSGILMGISALVSLKSLDLAKTQAARMVRTSTDCSNTPQRLRILLWKLLKNTTRSFS